MVYKIGLGMWKNVVGWVIEYRKGRLWKGTLLPWVPSTVYGWKGVLPG